MKLIATKDSFGLGIKTLEDAIATMRREAEEAEKVAKEKRKLFDNAGYSLMMLKKLPMSWADSDPGKYGDAYWFLDKKGSRAVVRELIPNDTRIFSASEGAEYKKYREGIGY